MDGFSEALPEYATCSTDDERKVFKKNELQKLVAVLFLHNADHVRYGELLTDYRRQYANDFDIYPKTLEAVIDVMRQMPAKRKKPSKNNKAKDKPKEEEGSQQKKGNLNKSLKWSLTTKVSKVSENDKDDSEKDKLKDYEAD